MERAATERNCQKAVKGWLRQGLAKGMRGWIEHWQDACAHNNAQKAVMGWRNGAKAKVWRSWMELVERAAVDGPLEQHRQHKMRIDVPALVQPRSHGLARLGVRRVADATYECRDRLWPCRARPIPRGRGPFWSQVEICSLEQQALPGSAL